MLDAAAQLDAATALRDAALPGNAQIAAAQAQIAQAEAQVQGAAIALGRLTIRSPIPGTVARIAVNPGEWVTVGQPLLVISDLEHLQVETKDLSERDVTGIRVGQRVTVLIKPLGQEIPGQVKLIAPLADTLGGEVVYKTTIMLDALPPGLRAGMSVDVRFGAVGLQ